MTTTNGQEPEDLFAAFHDAFDDPEEPKEASNGDLPPIARNTDPETSHEAAEQVVDRVIDVERIRRFVAINTGWVRGEIAEALEMDQWNGARRVSDCIDKEFIFYGVKRRYSGSGRNQATCWPTEAAARESFNTNGRSEA